MKAEEQFGSVSSKETQEFLAHKLAELLDRCIVFVTVASTTSRGLYSSRQLPFVAVNMKWWRKTVAAVP